MELDELREMSPEDLRVKERETREEVFRLRLKLRTNQLDNPAGLPAGAPGIGADHDRARTEDSGGRRPAAGPQGQRCGSELSGAKAWSLPPR